MRVVTTRAELAAAPARGRRAVVMTMGALHGGHLSLVRAARELADQVVVTIFVNPLQFGPTEDLARYPRDLAGDVAQLGSVGADLVFAPTVDEVYPEQPVVTVSAGELGTVLEGAHRPGHLDGVLTVVLKLLHLVRPDVALFGRKDAQQLVAVERMVADLDVGVEVVGVPIVRDVDGLALSSRNAYLSAAERSTALALPASLRAAAAAAERGGDAAAVTSAARAVLDAEPGLVLDYAALVDPRRLAPATTGAALLLLAARVGGTRLIDNTEIELAPGTGALGTQHEEGTP